MDSGTHFALRRCRHFACKCWRREACSFWCGCALLSGKGEPERWQALIAGPTQGHPILSKFNARHSSHRPYLHSCRGRSKRGKRHPNFPWRGGLWRNYRIEEVALPEAWHRDPRLVWEFYSMRRRVASSAKPNPAHFALAKLENTLQDRLFVCTQNVDSLHEQSGSRNVVHMHGELFKSRYDTCSLPPFDDMNLYEPPTEIPQCKCGGKIARFARTSAGLAKCRLNWIESTTRWSDARSSWLWEHRVSWSPPPASSHKSMVGHGRSTWDQRSLRTYPRSRKATWGRRVNALAIGWVVGIDTLNYLVDGLRTQQFCCIYCIGGLVQEA
jgi:hypothetical protein